MDSSQPRPDHAGNAHHQAADAHHDQHGHSHGDGHGRGHDHSHGHSHSHSHSRGGHSHTPADPAAEADLADHLDLQAEVLHAHLADLTAWIADLAADPAGRPVERVLDLGAGTGAGTFALLDRFPAARVTALDVSAVMLDRLRGTAAARGLADRVEAVEADLEAAWPALGPADLVWAANSLHHTADPDRVLVSARDALAPGGLFALPELDSFPRFLPDDLGPGLGAPGLEQRVHEVRARVQADHMPLLGTDWGPHLTAAGLDVVGTRHAVVDIPAPLSATGVRYAEGQLQRFRDVLADDLTPEDRAALDLLLDADGPASLRKRTDLSVHFVRPVWMARRPR